MGSKKPGHLVEHCKGVYVQIALTFPGILQPTDVFPMLPLDARACLGGQTVIVFGAWIISQYYNTEAFLTESWADMRALDFSMKPTC